MKGEVRRAVKSPQRKKSEIAQRERKHFTSLTSRTQVPKGNLTGYDWTKRRAKQWSSEGKQTEAASDFEGKPLRSKTSLWALSI